MKHRISILITVVSGILLIKSSAQTTDSLKLTDCYRLVRQNAPQLKLLALGTQETDIEHEKLTANNLPSIKAYGTASYQSDAIAIEFPFPGAEPFELDLFQYNVGLGIDQKIFDGGVVGLRKEIKAIEGDINNLETEVGLYKLNELVNKYFFGIAITQKTIEILQLKSQVLQERQISMKLAVKEGAVLASDLSRIQAEIISAQQQVMEADVWQQKLKESLGVLVNVNAIEIHLKLPESIAISDSNSRPEFELFEANRRYIESVSKIQNKRYIPNFNAFGHTGYSYPGLNMFDNKSDFYYIVGVKMGWNIFDWNQSKKEKQLLELKKSRVDVSQLDFERSITIASRNEQNEINHLRKIMISDMELINHKESITKASASALKNGTITSADYIRDLNEELHARHELEKHKIKLLEAQARLAVVNGVNYIN